MVSFFLFTGNRLPCFVDTANISYHNLDIATENSGIKPTQIQGEYYEWNNSQPAPEQQGSRTGGRLFDVP
jgi:hypothetical protein